MWYLEGIILIPPPYTHTQQQQQRHGQLGLTATNSINLFTFIMGVVTQSPVAGGKYYNRIW